MATVVGLDDIRREAEAQFGDLEVALPSGQTVRLRHALRLSKGDRQRLGMLGETIGQIAEESGDEDALVAAVGDVLLLVAESKTQGRALLSAIKGDLLTLMGLFRKYQEVCQVPEASRSTS
jgi:hypothetical protein